MNYVARVKSLWKEFEDMGGITTTNPETRAALIALVVQEEAKDARTTLIGEQRNAGRSQAASQSVPGSNRPAASSNHWEEWKPTEPMMKLLDRLSQQVKKPVPKDLSYQAAHDLIDLWKKEAGWSERG